MRQAHVNEGYELYQIISDFGNPLEIFREAIQNSFDENSSKIFINIYEESVFGGNKELVIDVLDNGSGLAQEKISHFFDTANSSKVDEKYNRTNGKHGYKGHGSKVFFNADKITICSKTNKGEHWESSLDDPISQIGDKGILEYTDPSEPEGKNKIPEEWESGFRVRIIGPKLFKSQQTRSHLNHIFLRDYIKWFSIFGTVETAYNEELKNKNIALYLTGLNFDVFKKNYCTIAACDPVPVFTKELDCECEKISFGHMFPEERSRENTLKAYVNKINSNKYWYEFYSKVVYNEVEEVGAFSFRLIISIEGYEAKRRYDLLLSRRGIANTEMNHTDASRYGLWACKGGVPVEKIDDWIEGGRGVGTYTYMQAFIDCDKFELTANRGSIRNTDIDILNMIKKRLNEVLAIDRVKKAIKEREDFENKAKTINSIKEDEKALKERFKMAQKKEVIVFSDGEKVLAPSQKKKNINESETFALLVTITKKYPNLFNFELLDYNTTKGIDFVVDYNGAPRYIELKGMLTKEINHPFKHIYKFIAYDIDVLPGETVEDIQEIQTVLIKNEHDHFDSPDDKFNGKEYTSYQLQTNVAAIQNMEIIILKTLLTEVLGARIVSQNPPQE